MSKSSEYGMYTSVSLYSSNFLSTSSSVGLTMLSSGAKTVSSSIPQKFKSDMFSFSLRITNDLSISLDESLYKISPDSLSLTVSSGSGWSILN
jgi:hypothetical protein